MELIVWRDSILRSKLRKFLWGLLILTFWILLKKISLMRITKKDKNCIFIQLDSMRLFWLNCLWFISGIYAIIYRYETNPMTVLLIYSHNEWHTLFIDIVGILGGIFTVASIIDHMVHSSIHFLIEKNRLNKLRWSSAMYICWIIILSNK